MMGAAVFNLIANLILIPMMGLSGAAIATVLSYGLGLVSCALIGARIFPLPLPWADIIKAATASLAMAACLYALPPMMGILALVFSVGLGGLSYSLLALILNIANCRDWISPVLNRHITKEAV